MEGSQTYGLIKLLCEQRHRSFRDLPLVDLRLYAFFTRHMDFEQPFFMSDVMKAIRNSETLVTQTVDFYRDFAHPDDFADVIILCAEKKVNAAYDLYSRGPIKKSEILTAFAERYGLRHSCGETWQSLTGSKSHYFSRYEKAAELGYAPRFSSRDVLIGEADAIVKNGLAWTSNAQ
jgi:nucleoside-diphosphate-sugar epimerase